VSNCLEDLVTLIILNAHIFPEQSIYSKTEMHTSGHKARLWITEAISNQNGTQ